jgi:DNA-directed RNA polymerase specialized sigma24 family protein
VIRQIVGASRFATMAAQYFHQRPPRSILLTRIEGLSMSEASRRTGASETALKVRVHRGLTKLAELARSTT